jgi:formylglycine-generating enzyme
MAFQEPSGDRPESPTGSSAAKSGRRVVYALGATFAVATLGVAYWGNAPRNPRGEHATNSSTGSATARSAPSLGSVTANAVPSAPPEAPFLETDAGTREEQNETLLTNLRQTLEIPSSKLEQIRAIFAAAKRTGQGIPKVTSHPMSRAECRERRTRADVHDDQFAVCGAKNMVPLYDRAHGETSEQAKLCIDRYEFPNLTCDYPVVWVSARDAHRICQALDKRLCDAHEWEGACAGAVLPVEHEYAFDKPRLQSDYLHNQEREIVWAYGKEKHHELCATGGKKSPGCVASGLECGSNTYPAGAFPECVSPFGVYDQHGNAAEHMNLPLQPDQLTSHAGTGVTEMKGSWFIFSSYEAHVDDCRWRAPSWHETKIMDPDSHQNYHLGFRCCKDIAP